MQTDNSANNNQPNTAQHPKDTPSGEGLSNPTNMTDSYTSKIQALLQGSSGMTLQDRGDAIRELLLQAQNQREIELLRKTSSTHVGEVCYGQTNKDDSVHQVEEDTSE